MRHLCEDSIFSVAQFLVTHLRPAAKINKAKNNNSDSGRYCHKMRNGGWESMTNKCTNRCPGK